MWAKALQVSHDSRRIFGADVDKKWLKGTVMEVLIHRPEGARRSTTMIKALYHVGNSEKVKILNLQILKKEDPTATAAAPATVSVVTAAAPPPEITDNGGDSGATAAEDSSSSQGAEESTDGVSQPTAASSVRIPVTTTNDGRQWYDGLTDMAVNGPYTQRGWRLTDQYTGKDYTPGMDESSQEIRAVDCFLALFPKNQLSEMVRNTNEALPESSARLTKGELLKWFGVTVLMTRFEFGERASLWATKSDHKYIPLPQFGRIMARERYNELFRYLVWSKQPRDRPDNVSHENWRWMLIEDFVANFNDHRKRYFHPSWQICVDESMSRWYGLGGNWINMGLPMYVAIDRKPEDGMEVQDACCAMSNVMMQLKIVKSADATAQ